MSFIKAATGVSAGFLLLSSTLLSAATPEQIAGWKKRHQQGVTLDKEGRPDEALAVFADILKEDPEARGSLFMSGLIHVQRFDFAAALPFLEKFQKLEPDHEGGMIALIKTCQALKNEEKVEAARKHLLSERSSGKNPRLAALLSYEREAIPRPGGGYVSVQENLDEKPGRFIWAYVEVDGKNGILRRLEWTAIQAPNAVQYALGEQKLEGGLTAQYKIHRLLNEKPGYDKARELALQIMNPQAGEVPKP